MITDNPQFHNLGVGAANAANDTVTLYYGAYDGLGDQDWAHPNYQNDAGLVGILLHDLGHMSELAVGFESQNKSFYQAEHGNLAGYVGSDYWRNNEKFANDFADAAADAFGEDTLTGVTLPYGYGSMDPSIIYSTNMGF